MARPRKSETVGAPAPRGLELELRRAFKPMIDQVRRAAARVRSAGEARALGAALRKAWPDTRIRKIVAKVMARAEQRAAAGWGKWERKAEARRTDAVDGEALVERQTKATTKLISSVRDEVAERMREDVVAALELGVDPSELAAGWVRQGIPVAHGTLEGRMRVIAQHQLSSLHAAVQSERARAIGATEFRWVTQEDDKVRPAHRARHGRTFAYADPPEGELPGQAVNCRCWAEALIPDELVFSVGAAFDT